MESNDSEETQSASEAVVHEVAEQENVQPEELNPSLFEVVDPDALDELFKKTQVVSPSNITGIS